jgi:hypothetical protein
VYSTVPDAIRMIVIFLGSELNSITMTTRLPDDKLLELRITIVAWKNKKRCTRNELESLVVNTAMPVWLWHLAAHFCNSVTPYKSASLIQTQPEIHSL